MHVRGAHSVSAIPKSCAGATKVKVNQVRSQLIFLISRWGFFAFKYSYSGNLETIDISVICTVFPDNPSPRRLNDIAVGGDTVFYRAPFRAACSEYAMVVLDINFHTESTHFAVNKDAICPFFNLGNTYVNEIRFHAVLISRH